MNFLQSGVRRIVLSPVVHNAAFARPSLALASDPTPIFLRPRVYHLLQEANVLKPSTKVRTLRSLTTQAASTSGKNSNSNNNSNSNSNISKSPIDPQLNEFKKLYGQNKFQEALRLFPALALTSSDPTLYATYINILSRLGKISEIRSVVDRLIATSSPALNRIVFESFFHALKSGTSSEELRKYWTLARKLTSDPPEKLGSLFEAYLAALNSCDHIDDIKVTYKEIAEKKIPIDSTTFSYVITSALRSQDMDLVSSVISDMEKLGVKHNQYTYAAKFRLCEIRKDSEGLKRLFEEAKNTLGSANANQYSYAAKFRLSEIRKDSEGLKRLFEEAKSNLGSANARVYEFMLHYYIRKKDTQSMEKLLNEMVKKKVSVDLAQFNRVLNYLEESEPPAVLDAYFAKMVSLGFKPDNVSYNILLNSLSKQHKLEQALDLVSKMRKAGVTPDVYTMGALTKTLTYRPSLSDYQTVTKLMGDLNISPNIVVFNNLVGCLMKLNHKEELKRVVGKMTTSKVAPNTETFNILLEMYCNAKDYKNALRVMEIMAEGNFAFSTVSYRLLMHLFLDIKETDRVLAVFAEMKRSGLRRYTAQFNMALRAVSDPKPENIPRIEKLLEEMNSENVPRDSYTYHELIKLHSGLKDFSKIDELLRDMEQRNIFVNFRTVDQILTLALTASNAMGLLMKYFRHAEKVNVPMERLHWDRYLAAVGEDVTLSAELNAIFSRTKARAEKFHSQPGQRRNEY